MWSQEHMPLRNNVGKWAKNITPELAKKYGIDNATFHKAMMGDENACKQIGQLANEGEYAVKFAPKVAQRMLQIIAGTNAVNQAVTNVSLATAQGTKQIEANAGKVQIANTKLVNERKENALKQVAQLELLTTKHQNNLEAIQMQASIDETTARVDHNYRMKQLDAKLPLQQMRADKEYKEARTEHLLENGNNSRVPLLPKKEYEASFIKRVIDFFSGN
jgi:hypothetical protein